MRLIPEEIAYLRRKKKELERRCEQAFYDIKQYDHDTNNGVKIASFDELNGNTYQHYADECLRLEQLLIKGQVVKERDFDKIDVGTGFYIRNNDTLEENRFVLTENSFYLSSDYNLISLNSNLGKAVLGKKDGDLITYKDAEDKGTISATILQIDRKESNYVSFIRDKAMIDRHCGRFIPYELHYYLIRSRKYDITPSQLELLKENIKKLDYDSAISGKDMQSLKASLAKSMEAKIAPPPKDDGTVHVGSRVEVLLNRDGVVSKKKFELIEWAYSTELDCDYEEFNSSLGCKVFHSKVNDRFIIDDNYFGQIISVDNEYNHKKERVR